ncbi:MAG: hypothetical protein L0154_24365 [Chloroflexi bacterium]|nr:hypothetical protein [Chloroflexota bacterium]
MDSTLRRLFALLEARFDDDVLESNASWYCINCAHRLYYNMWSSVSSLTRRVPLLKWNCVHPLPICILYAMETAEALEILLVRGKQKQAAP